MQNIYIYIFCIPRRERRIEIGIGIGSKTSVLPSIERGRDHSMAENPRESGIGRREALGS